MLVVKGSVKEGKNARERRLRRSLEHQEGEKALRNGSKNNNANIRAPQGIPGRGATSKIEPEAADVNPLRRLRDSQVIAAPKPRTAPRPDINGRGNESIRQPNLHANTPFFDKLKEMESSGHDEDQDKGRHRPAPLPRNPVRTSTVNSKPRERKYPLDLSGYCKTKTTSAESSDRDSGHGKSFISGPILQQKSTSGELNTSRDSEDSAFNTESDASSASGGGRGSSKGQRPKSSDSFNSYFPAVSPTSSQFSVKGVKWTAKELGLHDNADSFWQQEVDFEEMSGIPLSSQSDLTDENAPILGRYKNSDTVSYEDLLDFALDGNAKDVSHGESCVER